MKQSLQQSLCAIAATAVIIVVGTCIGATNVAWRGCDIYYLRHGEVMGNIAKRYKTVPPDQRPANWSSYDAFSPLGAQQVSGIVAVLKDYKVDAIVVSPTWRTMQTVLPYLRAMQRTAEIWPELTEISAATAAPKPGETQRPGLFEGSALRIADNLKPYFQPRDASVTRLCKTTHGYMDAQALTEASAQLLRARFGNSGKAVLVVGHAVAGTALIKRLTGITSNAGLALRNAQVSHVRQMPDGTFRLIAVNGQPYQYRARVSAPAAAGALPSVGLTELEAFPGATGVSGVVFWDDNNNGVRDATEAGAGGVPVTVQYRVITTDTNGAYTFRSTEPFLTVACNFPTGTWPTRGWFQRLTQPHNAHVDFGLRKDSQEPPFVFVHFTDPHSDLPQVAPMILRECATLPLKPKFYVLTGDLRHQNASVRNLPGIRADFGMMSNVYAAFPAPLFAVPGNHDLVDGVAPGTALAPDIVAHPLFAQRAWEKFVCPAYWAFSCGGAMFLGWEWAQWDGAKFDSNAPRMMAWATAATQCAPAGAPVVLFHHGGGGRGVKAALNLSGHSHTEGPQYGKASLLKSGAATAPFNANTGARIYTFDGRPPGYRIVVVESNGFDSFYKALTEPHTIMVDTPRRGMPVTNTDTFVVAGKVFDPQGTLSHVAVTCDGRTTPATRVPHHMWSSFTVILSCTNLSDGFHDVRVQATWAGAGASAPFTGRLTEPYLFRSGRAAAFAGIGAAVLTGHVYKTSAGAAYQLWINGVALTNLPGNVARFGVSVPARLLRRLNTLTLTNLTGETVVDQVQMSHGGRTYLDQTAEILLGTWRILDATTPRFFDLTYPGGAVNWRIEEIK